MNKSARDDQVDRFMGELLIKARDEAVLVDSDLLRKIKNISKCRSKGIREIVLTICIAKLLEPDYDPTMGLYDCKPRAIYEGSIRSCLRSEGIPHGKSGPLNIAKATKGLDDSWAFQRKDKEAHDVVSVAQMISHSDLNLVMNIGASLLKEMLFEAESVLGYAVDIPDQSLLRNLNYLTINIVKLAPDGGNTAQRIVGYALQAYHEWSSSKMVVEGHDDSASTTNVTSNKPGDIVERTADGTVQTVFEITTKPFERQRMEESIDAVKSFNNRFSQQINEVLVLCTSSDIPKEAEHAKSTNFHMGDIEQEGIYFNFLDLFEFTCSLLSRLGNDGRAIFYNYLNNYVNDFNTSVQVKTGWRSLHDQIIN